MIVTMFSIMQLKSPAKICIFQKLSGSITTVPPNCNPHTFHLVCANIKGGKESSLKLIVLGQNEHTFNVVNFQHETMLPIDSIANGQAGLIVVNFAANKPSPCNFVNRNINYEIKMTICSLHFQASQQFKKPVSRNMIIPTKLFPSKNLFYNFNQTSNGEFMVPLIKMPKLNLSI